MSQPSWQYSDVSWESGEACHVKYLWLSINWWGTHLADTLLLTQLLVQDGCDCFQLVVISFCKFPECDTIEVMFACCIIFMGCTTHLFMLTHHALQNMASSITVWWHVICITLSYLHLIFSCDKLHLRISYSVCIGFCTSRIILSHNFHLLVNWYW